MARKPETVSGKAFPALIRRAGKILSILSDYFLLLVLAVSYEL